MADVLLVRHPIELVILDLGEPVASRNVATFETLEEMADWYAAHKQQAPGCTFRFVVAGPK